MISHLKSKFPWYRSSAMMALLALPIWLVDQPARCFGQNNTEAAIKILERMDANKDGNLDPSEVPDRSRVAVERIAREAGVDANSSISITKLQKKLEQEQKSEARNAEREGDRENRDSPRSRDRGGRPDRSSRDDSNPTSGFSSSSSSTSTSSNSSNSAFGAESGSSKDPKVIAYVESLFKTNDKNRNGYIDGKEIETIRTRDNPKNWDSNKDGKLSKSEVTANLTNRGSSRSTSTAQSGSNTSPESNRTSGMARTSSSSTYQDRYKRYADSLLKRYDENKDGFLRKNEWGRVRNAEEADKNKDGVLTVDELAEQLKGMSSSSKRSTSSSAETPTSNSRSRRTERTTSRDNRADRSSRDRPSERARPSDRDRRDREGDDNRERRSYRALTAHERLPSGLPDWFTDKDENVNGQIEMAEYTSSWTDAKVREFAEYDLNDDGVITAVECLKSQ